VLVPMQGVRWANVAIDMWFDMVSWGNVCVVILQQEGDAEMFDAAQQCKMSWQK
jgi:hypothetical protein